MARSLYPHKSPTFWMIVGLIIDVIGMIAGYISIPPLLVTPSTWGVTSTTLESTMTFPSFPYWSIALMIIGIVIVAIAAMQIGDKESLEFCPHCNRRI